MSNRNDEIARNKVQVLKARQAELRREIAASEARLAALAAEHEENTALASAPASSLPLQSQDELSAAAFGDFGGRKDLRLPVLPWRDFVLGLLLSAVGGTAVVLLR